MARRGSSRQPVCKQFQSRHVGPGEAGAGDDLEQRGGPDAVGVEAISERAGARHRARRQPHATRVDAVGEAREHRNRQHVSAEVGAADPAGRRIAQCPLVPEQRLEREKHRERRHAQNFREADECDDAGRTRNFQPSNYISIGHAVEAPIRPHRRVPVQSRANRQLRGVTSTFRRAVNPVDVNVPSSRWVICLASGIRAEDRRCVEGPVRLNAAVEGRPTGVAQYERSCSRRVGDCPGYCRRCAGIAAGCLHRALHDLVGACDDDNSGWQPGPPGQGCRLRSRRAARGEWSTSVRAIERTRVRCMPPTIETHGARRQWPEDR